MAHSRALMGPGKAVMNTPSFSWHSYPLHTNRVARTVAQYRAKAAAPTSPFSAAKSLYLCHHAGCSPRPLSPTDSSGVENCENYEGHGRQHQLLAKVLSAYRHLQQPASPGLYQRYPIVDIACSMPLTAVGLSSCLVHRCRQQVQVGRLLLVSRAKGDCDSLLLQQVLAMPGVRQQCAASARGVEEARVDLAVAGQAGKQASPGLQGVCQDLHDLDAWHVPASLHCLWHLHPINPAAHDAC